jgi:hypothetical protein
MRTTSTTSSSNRRPRMPLGRAALYAMVAGLGVGALAACDSADDDDADVSAVVDGDSAWCQRFDRYTAATLRVDDVSSDEEFNDALADVEASIDHLEELDTPPEIADDWSKIGAPPATSATGEVLPASNQIEAMRRVAAWAVEHCELSDEVRAAIGVDG